MFIKLVLISFFLVGLVMLTLSVKLLFDKNATFTLHSCSTEPGADVSEGGCHSCQLKDLANCDETKKESLSFNHLRS